MLLYIFQIVKFPKIKAKYNVIEPHYMEGTTPDQLAEHVVEPYCLKLNPINDIYYYYK
jgi:hypothetical protein